jgi:hypothetical protein
MVAAASGDLSGCRLVFWRHTPHRVGDHAVNELETVVDARLIAAFGEPELQKRFIEKFTGVIAGKRAAGAICTLETGRKADDE